MIPLLDDIVATAELTTMEEAALVSLWKGRGLPVTTQRIFDAMYADDPDGGPSLSRVYFDFNSVLTSLRDKLSVFGFEIIGGHGAYRVTLSA